MAENKIKWKGVNIQGYCMEAPKDNERELILLMYCVDCKAVKDFTLTQTLTNLWDRKTAFIEFGTTCMKCNRKSRIKITWNDKPSWKFFKRESWDGEIDVIDDGVGEK